AAFILLDIFGKNITGPPIEKAWGWTYSIRENALSTISYIWMIIIPSISALLYLQYYRKVTNQRKKTQSGFMLFAGIITLSSVPAELVLQLTNSNAPPLSVMAFIIANLWVGYAIWKYELFTLTPSKAAESIIATMGDSLILVGLDGTIITANQATSKMLGYTEKELLNMPVVQFFAPNALIPDWIKETESHKADTFRSRDIETEYQTADGKIIPVSLSGSMLHDDEGNLRGFLLIARDITEQKRAAHEIAKHREKLEELVEERTHQLSRTNVQLQQEINERQKAETEKRDLQDQLYQAQKMEAIGRLAGGVAHDFNNLLFVINGYAETLIADMDDHPSFRNDVSQILEAGNRAVNLTRQLLAFSRKQIIDPILLDINERIASSVKMLSRMIGEDIQIEFSSSLKSGKVVMDLTQLDQIIANLLVNARDAMPKGGRIHIRTEKISVTSADSEKNPNRKPGHYIQLCISDTGCGIESDKLKMIFEPFYTSKGVGKGTGLGLATVYGIVKQNDGFIEVESTVNVGTSFRISLPQAGISIADELEMAAGMSARAGSETVLLVEDEHLVRRLAKRQLESSGYRVLQAVDAPSALEIFNAFEDEIDVLLTDVVMPGMSGVEMVNQIAARSSRVKIIFMSGHNDEIMDTHGIRKTRHPLLPKPFTAQQLCDKIREVVDGRISQMPPSPTTIQ
ncbi:MAG: response regulator, partial [Deltaproteobacteria bacterium]|nr:response regulator [Deltaproteobacteria bacterium]